MALTRKQQAFVDEYLIDLNATRAYMRAGYKASEESARRNASDLLTKPDIAAAIQQKMDERSKRTQIDADAVLTEIAKMAFFDPRRLYHPDGTPKAVHELDDETAAAVAGLDVAQIGNSEVGVGTVLKYKLSDKRASLELLGKHLKLFTERVEHTADDEIVRRLVAGRKRVADE